MDDSLCNPHFFRRLKFLDRILKFFLSHFEFSSSKIHQWRVTCVCISSFDNFFVTLLQQMVASGFVISCSCFFWRFENCPLLWSDLRTRLVGTLKWKISKKILQDLISLKSKWTVRETMSLWNLKICLWKNWTLFQPQELIPNWKTPS